MSVVALDFDEFISFKPAMLIWKSMVIVALTPRVTFSRVGDWKPGSSVLMRYTLRLLTLDQLGHAFDYCFGEYASCGVYGQLLDERTRRRRRAQEGTDGEEGRKESKEGHPNGHADSCRR